MRIHQLLSSRHCRKALATAGLFLAPLAGFVVTSDARAQGYENPGPVIRSVSDWRERISDELDRPRYKERWTHRGYEVVSDQITVIATTNIEDARAAAAEATKAWNDASALADQFTKVHRHKDFAIGALQVVIDGEPLRNRDQPLTTLNVVGQKNNVVVNVSGGESSLEKQAPRLREATVLAFLRTAELDVQYPSWVSAGIAGYLAEQGETTQTIEQIQPLRTTANIGGQQWRSTRIKQDELAPPQEEHAEAVARVRFLLEGEDSAHAPALFAALRASAQDLAERRHNENLVKTRRGEYQPPIASERGDQLFVSLEKNYANWEKDPLAGQPLYKPAAGISPELEQLQREMTLVLKLQRRFNPANKASTLRTKVVTYKKETAYYGGQTKISLGVSEPRDVFHDLTKDGEAPWATRDIDGSLLLSSNTGRLEELFGEDGRRFSRIRHNDKWVLASKLDNGRLLVAWLEENPATPSRPEVKFDTVTPNKPTPAKPLPARTPANQPRTELGPPMPIPPSATPGR